MGKFFPSGDLDLYTKVNGFAQAIANEPERYGVNREESDALSAAVKNYSQHLQNCRNGQQTTLATRAKNESREQVKKIASTMRATIRLNKQVDPASMVLAGVDEQPAKSKAQQCLQDPPRLHFMRALHLNGATPMHELRFWSSQGNARKPGGAVRLELFVDLLPPDEPIPSHPGANLHSRPWYLRSYTRSPIKIAPPMTSVPMRVVYWGRWADSTGNVGPFSATAVAWIEGGSTNLPGQALVNGFKAAPLLEDANGPERRERDAIYRVVMLEAQVQSFQPQMIPALPAREEPKQLEAPRESEAA